LPVRLHRHSPRPRVLPGAGQFLPTRPLNLSNVATHSGFRLAQSSSTLREDFWIASARVSYQFTRNFLANAYFVYRTNERTGDVLVGPSSDRYLVSVGFEYRFDPIHL
jgi:hypothetical protein